VYFVHLESWNEASREKFIKEKKNEQTASRKIRGVILKPLLMSLTAPNPSSTGSRFLRKPKREQDGYQVFRPLADPLLTTVNITTWSKNPRGKR